MAIGLQRGGDRWLCTHTIRRSKMALSLCACAQLTLIVVRCSWLVVLPMCDAGTCDLARRDSLDTLGLGVERE